MIRAWRYVDGLSDSELLLFEEAHAEFKVKEKIEEGKKWGRLYGGAGAVIGVKNSGSHRSELVVETIGKGDLEYIHVIDKNKLRIEELEDNPLKANYGEPKMYLIEDTPVHPSRVIAFNGIKVPKSQRHAFRNWGASIYQKMRAAIGRVNVAYGAGSAMLHEASLDIISIQGLFTMIGDCEGENKIMQRMTLSQLTKSNYNMLMKDTEEEFTKITQNFAGIPDMIREMVIAVSGASEIPVTRLLGISPSGLNATGQADLTNYYDSVRAKQILELGPKLKKFDAIIQQHVFGRQLPDFKSTFNDLWAPNKLEASDILQKTIDAHEKAMSFIPLEVILKQIQADSVYQITDEQITKAIADHKENQRKLSEAKNAQDI